MLTDLKNKHTYFMAFLRTLCIYLALLVIEGDFLFSIRDHANDPMGIVNGVLVFSLQRSILFFILLYAVIRLSAVSLPAYVRFLCLVFSLLMVIGYGLEYHDGIQVVDIFSDMCVLFWISMAIALAGTALLLEYAFRLITLLSDAIKKTEVCLPRFLQTNTYRKLWGILFLSWLPFAILRYPGGMDYDAYYQIVQFLDIMPLNDHWPIASSAVMGGFVGIGMQLFHSQNVGLFAFVIFQMLFSCGVLTYTLKIMEEMRVTTSWRVLCFFCYALVPLFYGYMTSIGKDMIYSMLVLLFLCLLIRHFFLTSPPLWALFAVGAALCVYRKNGIHVILLTGLCLLIYTLLKKSRTHVQLLSVFAVISLFGCIYNSAVVPALIDEPNPSEGGEALSFPFQQTARYLIMYPDDMTSEERACIAAVLDIDQITSTYSPIVSDPVKATYHGTTKDVLNYLPVWFLQFFRHPDAYFRATFDCVGGFLYPNQKVVNSVNSGMYHVSNYDGQLPFEIPGPLASVRYYLMGFAAIIENLPFMMPLCSAATYTWLLIFLLTREIHKKRMRHLFLLIPSAVSVLVCLASPTYSFASGVRYALPYIYPSYLLCGICCFISDDNDVPSKS